MMIMAMCLDSCRLSLRRSVTRPTCAIGRPAAATSAPITHSSGMLEQGTEARRAGLRHEAELLEARPGGAIPQWT